MQLQELKKKIEAHNGIFLCRQIHKEENRKEVVFRHEFESPRNSKEIPNIGKLVDFYETFGDLTLYYDQISGDAAIYIANPIQWDELKVLFSDWLDIVDEDEEDLFPEWIENYIVIGEVPASGNYFLMPTQGDKAGYIFEFEHDGFEFIETAKDIEEFIFNLLFPDGQSLVNMASHMRFVESGDYETQWWIVEMKDSFGNVVSTEC